MSGYQLCRSRRAVHPFYIESIDVNIYTIEELCFYFHQNLCLLDESVLNEKLCRWLGEELGLDRIGRRLQERLEAQEGLGPLILPIFKDMGYLSVEEYRVVQEQISRLEVQPEDIRRKTRADYLVNYGMYSRAVSVYQQILRERMPGRMGQQFYAAVQNNMAVAYARMFLFAEAAECLWKSYEMVHSNKVYRRYLAILPYYLSNEAYQERLEQLRVPKEQLESIEEEKKRMLEEFDQKVLFQDAGYEELEDFLKKEKKKYHKSRR